MPVEHGNKTIIFISELKIESKNISLILKKIIYVLLELLEGYIFFPGLKKRQH